ncbi:MAG TPA: sugar phosphate isomerase/epimerase family protein [Vicinamibacterales bacterium]|nr:sugar phosphate isomerase/epimerase family protein [Vicinamibacterales bacterium]
MRFGISTHIFHDRRLDRDHLAQIAGYGFDCIELFATRSHFDYHDAAAVEELARWLDETGLQLHGVHAPITDAFGVQGAVHYSNAAGAADRRQLAIREAEAALAIARRIPFGIMVVHLGTPAKANPPDDNHRAHALRSLERLCEAAAPLAVRIAAEVIPNRLSDAASLAALFDNDLDAKTAGICLDFGHAHLMGDVADAVETAAEHLITTHVHDNHGREDEHLVPYLGSIDWDLALVTMQKIGYDGTYLMELAGGGHPASILEEARRARQKFERALTHA